jgi:hypothetical protein
MLNGRRVDLATWRAANPMTPQHRYRADGEHWIDRASMPDEPEDGDVAGIALERQRQAVEWAREENHRREGLAAEFALSHGMGLARVPVGPVTPADWPGWAEQPSTSVTGRSRSARSEAATLSAIASAMGTTVDDPRMADILAVPVDHEPVERLVRRATADEVAERTSDHREAAASRFSAEGGRTVMPKHSKTRPSQMPVGRRQRYLRQVAEREGITLAAAAQLHPPRKAQPKEPQS